MKRSLFLLALSGLFLSGCEDSAGGATAAPANDPTAVVYPVASANTDADLMALKALGNHGDALGKPIQDASKSTPDAGDLFAGRIAGRLSLANAYQIDSGLWYCQGAVCSQTPIANVVPDTTYDTIISHTGTGTANEATMSSDSTIYEVSGSLEKTPLYVSRTRMMDTTRQVVNLSGSNLSMQFDIKASGYGMVDYRDGFQLTIESMKMSGSLKFTMNLMNMMDPSSLTVPSFPGSLYYLMSFTSNGAKYSAILNVRNQDLAALTTATGNVINSANAIVGTFELSQDGNITVKDLKGNLMR